MQDVQKNNDIEILVTCWFWHKHSSNIALELLKGCCQYLCNYFCSSCFLMREYKHKTGATAPQAPT